MSDEPKSLLPHLFIGEWTILAQADERKSSSRLQRVTIQPPDSKSKFKLIEHRKNQNGSVVELKHDPGNNTLRSESKAPLCIIAFWRYPSYDVIFAFQEHDGCPEEVWSARRTRILPGPTHYPPEGAMGKWKIVLSKGIHAAPANAHVTLAKLSVLNGDLELNPALYGVFQMESSPPKHYDILVYDQRTRCFNSIFYVRSLNYCPGSSSQPESDRLFATFNNRSSLPASRFGEGISVHEEVELKLGQLMPFERDSIKRAEPSGDDDPDVGVWVGEPP